MTPTRNFSSLAATYYYLGFSVHRSNYWALESPNLAKSGGCLNTRTKKGYWERWRRLGYNIPFVLVFEPLFDPYPMKICKIMQKTIVWLILARILSVPVIKGSKKKTWKCFYWIVLISGNCYCFLLVGNIPVQDISSNLFLLCLRGVILLATQESKPGGEQT